MTYNNLLTLKPVSPPESSKATYHSRSRASSAAKVPLCITTSNSLQTQFSQILVNKALFGGRQAAWVLNRVTITTILQVLKWRWLNQIVSNYRKYHFSNACFLFINFDTGRTENKYVKSLHQILSSSEGQQLKGLPSQGHTCTTD